MKRDIFTILARIATVALLAAVVFLLSEIRARLGRVLYADITGSRVQVER